MDISEETGRAFRGMVEEAERLHLEYVTPELLLLHIAAEPAFQEAFENCQGEIGRLAEQLEDYVNGLPVLSEEKRKEGAEPEASADLNELLLTAEWAARSSGRKEVALSHLVSSYFSLKESFALYYLTEQGIEKGEFLLALIEAEEKDGGDEPSAACLYSAEETGPGGKEEAEKLDEAEDAEDLEDEADAEGPENRRGKGRWKRFAVCLNEEISLANPLIGREKELERTMQILCRKEKNNPLHIGEPGVGKTAVVYGLARLLSEGKVPEPLKGAKIYALDLGGMLAGTQYRGDFEKRLKSVLSGLSQEEKPIVYLDEIHNIVGAGAVGEGSLDASNLLKPYLASGKIRFIGATTHEEYKRYFEKSRSLARRFQNVGYRIFATRGTSKVLNDHGIKALTVQKLEQESPNILDLVLGHQIDLIIDIPAQGAERSHDGFIIRRNAIETGVNVLTSLDTANALVTSLENRAKELTLIDIATVKNA